jgi:soluble lytic murein transglycosylase-like protein
VATERQGADPAGLAGGRRRPPRSLGPVRRARSAGAALGLTLLLLAGCAEVQPDLRLPESVRPRILSGSALAPLPPDSESLALARAILARQAPRLDGLAREGVARVVAQAERETRVPALMLLAVMQQESRFDPRAVGPRGSLGLMQVQPSLGRALAPQLAIPWREGVTLFDPIANARIGARYLADLVEAFGEHELALAAYNMGPTRLRQRLAAGASGRTSYAQQVLARYQTLRTQYAETPIGLGG